MKTVSERLAALRGLIRQHGLSHYLVPSSDEHLNEYLPVWHQRRAWLSGFTGSAGDLLVGLDTAETWLFTDSRYHLQAEEELAGSGVSVTALCPPIMASAPLAAGAAGSGTGAGGTSTSKPSVKAAICGKSAM